MTKFDEWPDSPVPAVHSESHATPKDSSFFSRCARTYSRANNILHNERRPSPGPSRWIYLISRKCKNMRKGPSCEQRPPVVKYIYHNMIVILCVQMSACGPPQVTLTRSPLFPEQVALPVGRPGPCPIFILQAILLVWI
jgi:hypothetical protein